MCAPTTPNTPIALFFFRERAVYDDLNNNGLHPPHKPLTALSAF